jgi:N6-adenosine-specific RNA methylase IME4
LVEYGRRVGVDRGQLADAMEGVLTLERLTGGFIADIERQPRKRTDTGLQGATKFQEACAEAGLERTTAHRLQELAGIDADVYRAAVKQLRPRFVNGDDNFGRAAVLNLCRKQSPPDDVAPLPDGQWRCIVADPPWDLRTGPFWNSVGGNTSLPLPYPTMTLDQIAELTVAGRAAPDAHLYLWTVNRYLPNAYEIARAWGFKPSTLLVWCKTPHGLGPGGAYALTTEYVLLATRGTLTPLRRVDTTWFQWPRRGHSVKPAEFYDLVETVTPGPYLDLFGRREREGWTVWGNEVAA